LATRDRTLLVDLERLLEPAMMGDPMRALRWVSKSHDKLATALLAIGHKVSSSSIPRLLEGLKYCRHSNAGPRKAANIPIATPSSNISMPRSRSFRPPINR